MIHLDTSFLVDLLRETGRGTPGPATALLEDLPAEDVGISVFVACELFAGAELSKNRVRETKRVRELAESTEIAYPDERFPSVHASILISLERSGQRVSVMDLLIGVTAVVADAPLVTKNVKDFSRIPGLKLVEY